MTRDPARRSGPPHRFGIWDSERHYADDLYWARVLRSIHERAHDVGAELVDLPSPDDPSDDGFYADLLARIRSAGVQVVLDWPHAEARASTVLDAGMPIVHLSETALDHPLLIAPEGLETVAFDLVTRAANALGGNGTILAVGGGMQRTFSDDGASRLRGSLRAADALPGIRLLHVPTFWDGRAADQVARAVRDRHDPIDAIVGFSDRVATLARRVCLDAGVARPDVPTFGINGTPDAIAAILAGTMTATSEGPADDVGRQAVDAAVAVAGRTRYPRRFPYRFRYVDASLAPSVAARMLVDLGSALRTPRTTAVRELRVAERFTTWSADADRAFTTAGTLEEAWSLAVSALQRRFDAARVVAAWPASEAPKGDWVLVASDLAGARIGEPDPSWSEAMRAGASVSRSLRDAVVATVVPLEAGPAVIGCLEVRHDAQRLLALSDVDGLRDAARHLSSLALLRGRGVPAPQMSSRGTTGEGSARVTVWAESAATAAPIVDALRSSLGDAAVGVHVLPSSRRRSWDWQGPPAVEVGVAVLARWTPDVSDWIGRWREERGSARPLLVVSAVPWPAEAFETLPRDLRAVIHSTLTLPPDEVVGWVASRMGDGPHRPTERAYGVARSIAARLHAAFDQPLQRTDLATELGVQPDRMSRWFRHAMGVTPRTYLVRLRVHHAMGLLRTTERSVTDIGASVGWPEPAHFSSAFRRETGRSPRRFRKEVRGDLA